MKLTYAYLAAHHPRPNHIFAQGIVCLLLIFSSAGNAAQSGDFTYNVLNSTVTITGYTGGGGNVAIPDTIAEMPVAMIGERAFLSCKTLTDITLPASLTSIGALAFASCSGLTSLTLPENVTSIGVGAFRSCSGLRNITVATLNPRYIDRDGVLFNKDETTLILYPAGRAGRYEIPNTVSSIGDEAFMNCHWLTSVTLPASLTTIGSGVFVQCNDLTNLTVDAFNPNYSERDGVVFNKDHATLVQYPPGREGRYDVPDGVMGIGDWAFSSFYLTSITLPESLTSIGAYAFYNSGGLTSITLPANVTSIGSGAFWFCSGLTSITLPDSVNGIGSHAFAGCSGLTNIAFGNRLTSIDSYAFVGCLRLTAIALPDSVTSVGDGAFYGCSALASVTLPNSVTSIGYESFSGCARLTSVTLPKTVGHIGDWGFSFCKGITALYFAGNAPTLGEGVFQSDTNATVYYVAGTLGWGTTFGGLPTAIWEPSYAQWAEMSGLVAKYPDASREQDDADQDGLTNIQEMAAGTDPTERTSALLIEALARPDGLSEDDKTPVKPTQFAIYFRSVPRKTYEIQSTDTLGASWTTAASMTATTTQKRVILDRPAGQRFYRVVMR